MIPYRNCYWTKYLYLIIFINANEIYQLQYGIFGLFAKNAQYGYIYLFISNNSTEMYQWRLRYGIVKIIISVKMSNPHILVSKTNKCMVAE